LTFESDLFKANSISPTQVGQPISGGEVKVLSLANGGKTVEFVLGEPKANGEFKNIRYAKDWG